MKLKQHHLKLGVIGFGNMATALVNGILKNQTLSQKQISFLEPDANKIKAVKKQFGIQSVSNLKELCEASNTLLLAVKPQSMNEVLTELKCHLRNHLVITIAAGIPVSSYRKLLGPKSRIVRVMPNTPALIGLGASAYFATSNVTRSEKESVENLLHCVGIATAVKNEDLLDAVTAVSASGPAFVYQFAQAMITSATRFGLSAEIAKMLVLQTLRGATEMMVQSSDSPDVLTERVRSKKGTTDAGLNVLAKKGFAKIISACLTAARNRAREMGKLY